MEGQFHPEHLRSRLSLNEQEQQARLPITPAPALRVAVQLLKRVIDIMVVVHIKAPLHLAAD